MTFKATAISAYSKFKDNMVSWDPISKESNLLHPQKKLATILVEKLEVPFGSY